jgi:molybdopterin synthase catalytic subunit
VKVDLRETALSLDEAVASVSRPGAGAVATFLGVVRDVSDGRVVSRLEYSAYDAMAKREMQKIVEELEAEMPGVLACAIHRIGSLAVGDAAIVCAASAPHRGEAFRACRELIDRIKARVPIWKRELGPDGAAWVGWVDARCTPHDDDPAGEHVHQHVHGHPAEHVHQHVHGSPAEHAHQHVHGDELGRARQVARPDDLDDPDELD